MKTKKESEPGGEKRTEIGLEGKKRKNRSNPEASGKGWGVILVNLHFPLIIPP